MSRWYCALGFSLLAAYLIQDWYPLKWPWLVQMQTNDLYKQISGFGLALFTLSQWHLSLFRMQRKLAMAHKELSRHRQWGVLAPVFFYLHAHSFGYAYLFLFSTLYLVNFGVGLLHPYTYRTRNRLLVNAQLVTHVSLSCFLTILLSYHVFISYWYE